MSGDDATVSSETVPGPVSRLVSRVESFNDWFLHRIPLGPAVTRPRQVINLHKISVGPLTLALMAVFDDFTLAAWLYLALHGLYGILWVAKDIAYGDPNWTKRATVGSAIGVFLFPLGLYYLPPLLMLTPLGALIPGAYGTTATLPLPIAFAAVALFILGAFFHFVSDAQKYFVLKHQRPRRLITDGMFALTRNPNYLGEILIYSSFNLLAQHWLPWACCALVWTQVFLVNMLRKEKSMSRYPEHAEWVRDTGFLLPSLPTLAKKIVYVFRLPPTA